MRLREFQNLMQKEEIDLVLLSNSTEKINPNFVYFTQLEQINAVLLLNKNSALFASPLELSIAKTSKIKDIRKIDKDFFENIKKSKPNTIGIDKNFITINQFKNLKSKFKNVNFKDVSKEIQKLRTVKTDEEIALIKKSCRFADLLIEESLSNVKRYKTELDFKKFIEQKLLDLNLEQSFNAIVASSVNSKNPHHLSNSTKLKGFTVIDLGVKYKNYCSDMTRTVFFGKPNKKQIKFYNKVLNIQSECINKDLSPSALHKLTQRFLGKYFIHRLGHGIGIEVHENPVIGDISNDKFENNMVFTLEPGYYNKFGIRIEDVFLYKNNKKIPLTKSPKILQRI